MAIDETRSRHVGHLSMTLADYCMAHQIQPDEMILIMRAVILIMEVAKLEAMKEFH